MSSFALEDKPADRETEGVGPAGSQRPRLRGRVAPQRLPEGLATQTLSRTSPQSRQVAIKLIHPFKKKRFDKMFPILDKEFLSLV